MLLFHLKRNIRKRVERLGGELVKVVANLLYCGGELVMVGAKLEGANLMGRNLHNSGQLLVRKRAKTKQKPFLGHSFKVMSLMSLLNLAKNGWLLLKRSVKCTTS